MQFAVHAVERPDRLAFGSTAHDHPTLRHLVGVEGMERLTEFEEDVVRYVHDVVYRAAAHGYQPVLHPLGGRAYLQPADGQAAVARRAVRIRHLDRKALAVFLARQSLERRLHLGLTQLAGDAAEFEVGVQVACNAPMRGGVHTVRRDLILDDGLSLDTQIFFGGSAHRGILRKDLDAGVVFAETEFVVRADHSKALHSADFRLLDLEVAGEDGAHLSEKDFLPGRHIGRAADDLHGLSAAVVNGRYVEMVRIRMGFAGEHFRDHDSFQSAFDNFSLFHRVHFDADGGHRLRDLLHRKVTLQIVL